jgi:hypothetical protein
VTCRPYETPNKEDKLKNPERFEQARRIADTASELDSNKNDFPEEMRDIATICVENLHVLAEKLAGNRVDQIYS